jgi:4-hydroxy-3-methylbut-2-enyl diphosphate reductase
MGQVGAPVHLVSSKLDVDRLDVARDTPVAYVTQTTLSIDDTRNIIEALKDRFRDIIGPDTSDICYATQNRQSAVRKLCRISDVILVVGSKNSSNSNRLCEIGIEEDPAIADRAISTLRITGKETIGTTGRIRPGKTCARHDRCAAPH